MSTVSYQAILGPGPRRGEAFVALGPRAICTRRKDAGVTVSVAISKAQRGWLDDVAEQSGKGIDRDAVVRALIDLGRELDVDWALLAGAGQLRDAVRDSVRVRRAAGDV